jgi:NAD(P)-dependent dehydrogenase (short-subunit alcohol dehydrogenase family)
VEQAGGEALMLPTDVSDFEAVQRAGRLAEDIFGPIDVWINDAMASVFSPFLQMHPDEYRRVTEVTYLGYVHGTRVALDPMVPRDRASWSRSARRSRTAASRC